MKYQQCLIFFLAESSLFVFIRVIIFDTKGGQVRCTGSSQKSYRLFYAINIQMSYRFFYSTFKSHTVLFSCQFNFQMSYHFFLVKFHFS